MIESLEQLATRWEAEADWREQRVGPSDQVVSLLRAHAMSLRAFLQFKSGGLSGEAP